MKKLIMAILGIAIFTISCNKSNELVTNPTNITGTIKTRSSSGIINFNGNDYRVDNGILNFETFYKYENIVNTESRESLIEFANLVEQANLFYNYNSIVSDDEKEQFEFIGKLINKDGFIKIDAFLILVDFPSKKVYAQKNGNTSDILSAKNGTSIQSVLAFSIEEDVIEELKIYKSRGLFCNDAWQQSFDVPHTGGTFPTNLVSNQNTPGGTIQMQVFINTSVKYWPAGIYFELNSRVVVTPAGNPLATAPFSYTTTYSCKRRCGNSFSGTSTRTLNTSNDKNVMYWNTRALRQGYTSISSTVSSSASVPANLTRTASY
jgi:hypothetical protein